MKLECLPRDLLPFLGCRAVSLVGGRPPRWGSRDRRKTNSGSHTLAALQQIRIASCATPPALVVDLTQIENSPLQRFVGSQAMVFYDAEIAMILAVFLRWMLRRNMPSAGCQVSGSKGRYLVFTLPFFQMPMMKTQHLARE
jgi:hypothetical protein